LNEILELMIVFIDHRRCYNLDGVDYRLYQKKEVYVVILKMNSTFREPCPLYRGLWPA